MALRKREQTLFWVPLGPWKDVADDVKEIYKARPDWVDLKRRLGSEVFVESAVRSTEGKIIIKAYWRLDMGVEKHHPSDPYIYELVDFALTADDLRSGFSFKTGGITTMTLKEF